MMDELRSDIRFQMARLRGVEERVTDDQLWAQRPDEISPLQRTAYIAGCRQVELERAYAILDKIAGIIA